MALSNIEQVMQTLERRWFEANCVAKAVRAELNAIQSTGQEQAIVRSARLRLDEAQHVMQEIMRQIEAIEDDSIASD